MPIYMNGLTGEVYENKKQASSAHALKSIDIFVVTYYPDSQRYYWWDTKAFYTVDEWYKIIDDYVEVMCN